MSEMLSDIYKAQHEFQVITGASDDEALAFLSSTNGNVQLAVARFFDAQVGPCVRHASGRSLDVL